MVSISVLVDLDFECILAELTAFLVCMLFLFRFGETPDHLAARDSVPTSPSPPQLPISSPPLVQH
jgi:hypothetical protein